jgi:hypothetical protein
MAPSESRLEAAGKSMTPGMVSLPASTAWPIVLAFGVTLLFAGLVTSSAVSVLGALLMFAGCAGWFRDVLPHEKQVEVRVRQTPPVVTTQRGRVARLALAPDLPRALLPLETYPISAGIKGGLAGGGAMAALACLYGLVKQGSVFYPINLLGATFYGQSASQDTVWLNSFHLPPFLLASALHLLTSLLVGLFYGAMLPMFPRRPILLGGLIAPLTWTGLLYTILDLVNPLLNQRIDWPWFVASQFGFGVVAGLVVVTQERVRIRQFLPFAMRAGFEIPLEGEEKRDEGERK